MVSEGIRRNNFNIYGKYYVKRCPYSAPPADIWKQLQKKKSKNEGGMEGRGVRLGVGKKCGEMVKQADQITTRPPDTWRDKES